MAHFTFIFDYRGGTYVQQVESETETDAVGEWIRLVNLDEIQGLTAKSRTLLSEGFLGQELTPLSQQTSVWCLSARLRGSLALVHLVKTEV